MLSSASSSMRLRSLLRRNTIAKRWFAAYDDENLHEDDPATNATKTALYELHKALGGELVPFAGYLLPIMYKGDPETSGILKEHLWCRTPGKASLFDVSHMGQVCEIH